ncbi:MAG: hypothetical protein EAX86_03200 [Candidatus Heimdallarchaeota archaeon]|nr:hypothetical protein [Candidatus Heimdallarchaeota archaeon]
MNTQDIDPLVEDLAWEVLIVSAFRQAERQTLNLITSLVGVTKPEELSCLVSHIFRLVRRGVIYIPEARLEIMHHAPELIDVYLLKDFNEVMRELAENLKKLRIEEAKLKHIDHIPNKVLIDLKNLAAGKYIYSK